MNWFDRNTYGKIKDLVCKRNDIKCNDVTKQCKKWLTLMIF